MHTAALKRLEMSTLMRTIPTDPLKRESDLQILQRCDISPHNFKSSSGFLRDSPRLTRLSGDLAITPQTEHCGGRMTRNAPILQRVGFHGPRPWVWFTITIKHPATKYKVTLEVLTNGCVQTLGFYVQEDIVTIKCIIPILSTKMLPFGPNFM